MKAKGWASFPNALSPPYFLRRGLSQKLELTELTREPQGSSSLNLPGSGVEAGVTTWSFLTQILEGWAHVLTLARPALSGLRHFPTALFKNDFCPMTFPWQEETYRNSTQPREGGMHSVMVWSCAVPQKS